MMQIVTIVCAQVVRSSGVPGITWEGQKWIRGIFYTLGDDDS